MGLTVPSSIQISETHYRIEYSKKGTNVAVTAPNLDDVKALFDYVVEKMEIT